VKYLTLALTLLALAGCGGSRAVNPQFLHVVNPGAKVLITENCPLPGDIIGLFFHSDESIRVKGDLDEASYVLVHEYQHLIEKRLHDAGQDWAVVIVRKAFRDLNAPGFEIGNADLLMEF
jgi:hypothetical protein